MCDMKTTNCSMAVLALCALAALVSAQVTFSRDWTGGKRSGTALFNCEELARICRHFLHDLRQKISTDKLTKQRRMEEYLQVAYDDEK